MNTEWSKPTKFIAGIGLVLVGIYILYLIRSVIPLLVVAALIAVVVRPVILWLHEGAHLPRGLAVALVYLFLAVLVPLGLLVAFPTIVAALGYVINLDYPGILKDLTAWLQSTLASIKAAQLPTPALDTYADRIVDTLLAQLQQVNSTAVALPPSATILRSLSSVLASAFDAATSLVGVVISQIALLIFMFLASIYISLEAHTYRGALLRLWPPTYQPEIAVLLGRIERLWNSFFRGELTLMLVIGVMSWLGLIALGVPGALYLGIIAGLLELIPNLGPIIATVPAVIVALLQGSSYLPVSNLAFAGLVILLYILIQQLENNIIVPRVLGDAVHLPPLVVMVGVLVGATTGGILGALLATPLVASGYEILRYIHRKILGEEPFLVGDTVLRPATRRSTGLFQSLGGWLRDRLPRQMLARPSGAVRRDHEASPFPEGEPKTEDYPQSNKK